MASAPIGSKRLVSGAHYGLIDWLAQRVTAIAMAIYTVIVLGLFFSANNFSYAGWAQIFADPLMKAATLVVIVALAYHAWIGTRDIWMDYIKPVSLRLSLQVLTILWLLGCVAYAVQILWKV